MNQVEKRALSDLARWLKKCPMCLSDPEVACPRGVDAKCLECGREYCGRHIGEHLQSHQISLTWRGILKEVT